MNNEKKNRFMPLLMAICVSLVSFIGSFYAIIFSGNRLTIINNGSNRLNNLLRIKTTNMWTRSISNSLVEKAIPEILSELDPHSVYNQCA